MRCSARRASTGGNATSVAYFKYGDDEKPATTIATPINLGTSYRLTTMVRGSQFECSIGAAKINVAACPSATACFRSAFATSAVRVHNIVAYQLGSP